MKLLDIALLAALVCALLSGCLLAAGRLASAPTVYRSWPDRTCRAVLRTDGAAGDCAAVPAVHHVVWVSPSWKGPR